MVAISSMSNSAVRIAFIVPPTDFVFRDRGPCSGGGRASAYVLAARPVCTTGARQWDRANRFLASRWTAGFSNGLYSLRGWIVEIDVLSEPARFEPTRFDGLQPMKFRLDG